LKKQLNIEYVTERGKPDSNTPIDEINAWFALTIKNRQMEETVEHRVDIVAASYMMGTYKLFICLFITHAVLESTV